MRSAQKKKKKTKQNNNQPNAAHSRDLIVCCTLSIWKEKKIRVSHNDNKQGDYVALMSECVSPMCQREEDMQCCGNDRWHPAYINPERCQADSFSWRAGGNLRCNM